MLKPCSIRDRDSTAENGRTVKQTIRMSIARVNARCTSRGILTTTLFAIWPGRWDWCLNLARGRVLHSWFANLSDTVLHSPVINSRGRWLNLEASKPPSGGDGSIGVVRPGWCVSSEVRPASRQQPRVHMLHALRSEGRGDALEQLHQLCWSTAIPSGARNSLPLRSQQARRARVELAAKRVRPQWTWAKPAAKRRQTTSLPSLEDYIETKYRRTIRTHATYSAVTFSTSKGQSSPWAGRSANS